MLELVSLRGAEGNDRNDFWSLFRCHKSGSLALTRAKKSLSKAWLRSLYIRHHKCKYDIDLRLACILITEWSCIVATDFRQHERNRSLSLPLLLSNMSNTTIARMRTTKHSITTAPILYATVGLDIWSSLEDDILMIISVVVCGVGFTWKVTVNRAYWLFCRRSGPTKVSPAERCWQ